jgi:serine/threonine protein phosphatase PrpC
MTRSFGDLIAASVGVVAKPEVWQRTIEVNDQFMILASDGVWEFITSHEAVEMVKDAATPEEACQILVAEATERWQAEEEVIDDITALVVYFPDSDLSQRFGQMAAETGATAVGM